MHHKRSWENESLENRTKEKVRMDNHRKNGLRHKQIRLMGRLRKTLGSGANSIKSSSITSMNVDQNSHWWLS
jgi:hypothetical protein